MVFILTRNYRTVSTYNEEFKVYSSSTYSYRFDEISQDLVEQSMPRGKNDSKCIIY